jgi:putative nucleotidyltransferase with HDIG domain
MNSQPKGSDFGAYSGRWVAMIRGRIVGQGGTPEQAIQAAKTSRHKEIPQVIFIPPDNPLKFPDVTKLVRDALPKGIQGYLVGGAVRDALLLRTIHDFDFVLSGDVIKIARKVANQIGGAFYVLDETRGAARVVAPKSMGGRKILDFIVFQGPDLESDLKNRDFTINAMAVDLNNPQQLLDPLNGASDLLNKSLRVCSKSSIENDPIRILRAVRLAAGFNLRIQSDTRALMGESIQLLVNISPERLRDELFRILEGPKPHVSLRALDYLGAISYILPDISALKDVSQSLPHIKDAWDHTIDTLKNLEHLLDQLRPREDREIDSNLMAGLYQTQLRMFRQEILDHLQKNILEDRSLRALIFLAALYHDVGKPQTHSLVDDGRIRFIHHEDKGAAIAARRGIALRLSKKEIDRLKITIRNHMRPTLLAREEHAPSARAIYRYFRDTNSAGIDICLISLADLLATYGNTLPQERWSRQLEIVAHLMEAWWNQSEIKINPPTLINGHDLIKEFGIKPGPRVGELLEMVREAQVMGEIATREDAISFVLRCRNAL